MNALVKKEIRLVLPAWSVAVLLAMVQGITRPYDFYVASLLFFGLTIMALSTIGRETSLNTFSSLLAQPAERIKIWQVKLSVLAVAFLVVLLVWLAAFGIALVNSNVDQADRENSYNLFITVCLIATATFTGGLWTTLLLRQIAGSFWLTLLVPATLSGFSAAFFAATGSESLAIAMISVIIGIYSIGGFFFARFLYFRAQDVGWSGGVIILPEWKFLSRARAGEEVRKRRPVLALLKKEVLLQQGVLTGAVGLLVLHIIIVLIRTFHHFQRDSAGEILSAIFWMLWLVFPVVVGSIAVAEERKLGVMENQLCLPASRRLQFTIKALVTLFLGVVLGGVIPVLVEAVGYAMGVAHPVVTLLPFLAAAPLFSAWMVLVSFFASSLARNFLHSIGLALVTFIVFGVVTPTFTVRHMLFFDSIARDSALKVLILVPTVMVTLLWLAWLNYKDYRSGWILLRRSIFGAVGATLFVAVATEGIYNRAWEAFEPVEPPHGTAKLSLANPPIFANESFLQFSGYNNFGLQVQSPDGHLWFDWVTGKKVSWADSVFLQEIMYQFNPLPESVGPHQLDDSTNWISASRGAGPLGSVAIHADGSLWASDQTGTGSTNAENLVRYGSETNWQQLKCRDTEVLLIKNDGTLWYWGTNSFDWKQRWPGLQSFTPHQLGTNSDWCELYSANGFRAQRVDGSVWIVGVNKRGSFFAVRDTWFEHIARADRFNIHPWGSLAYVRTDGTLWSTPEVFQPNIKTIERQIGHETNWVSSVGSFNSIFALKSDGTLWQWGGDSRMPWDRMVGSSMRRLGIHNDWVALAPAQGGAVTIAADGSVWFWPDNADYAFNQLLLKLPKQPKYLGNIFNEAG